MWQNNDEIEAGTLINGQWNPPVVQMQQWQNRVIRIGDTRLSRPAPVFELQPVHFTNGPWQHQGQAATATGCGQQGTPWSPAGQANTLPNHAVNTNIPPQVWTQWSANNQQGTTYADHAKKNTGNRMTSNTAPNHFESNQGWSTKVDQPWDANPRGVPAVNIDNKNDWNGTRTRWAGQWGPQGASTDWVPRTEGVQWSNARPLAPTPLVTATAVPTAPWPNPQPMPPQVEQLEINPQTTGTWVPQQSEMNNDMMWHDPNPKQKKVTRDNGTALWGEPSAQLGTEIRRWKEPDLIDVECIQSATTSGGDWDNVATTTDTGCLLEPPSENVSRKGERLIAHQLGGMKQIRHHGLLVVNDLEGLNIPEMLGKLIERGLIDISQLNSQMSRQLQILIARMYKKVLALEGLQKLQQVSQKGQAERAAVDAQALKVELSHLKDTWNELQMKSQNELLLKSQNELLLKTQGMNGMTHNSNDGQSSRLSQWTHGDAGTDKINAPSDADIQNLISATGAMGIEEKGDWRTGSLDWSSNPVISGRGSEDVNGEKGQTIVAIAEKAANSLSNTPEEPAVDDGPPEFVPGKKWMWRDPNKLAEDPNAKPGDVKPNPLLSSSSSGALQSGGKYFSNDLAANKGWPSHHDVWNPIRNARPFLGQPSFQPRMPMGQNFFRQQNPYILIYLNSPGEQEQILYRCTKVGSVSHYMSIGNIIYVRFNEPAEVVLPRLKSEIPSKMKIMSENDMERNMKLLHQNSFNSILPFNGNWGALVNNEWPFHGQLPNDINTGIGYPY